MRPTIAEVILHMDPHLRARFNPRRDCEQAVKAVDFFLPRKERSEGCNQAIDIELVAEALKLREAPVELAAKACGLAMRYDRRTGQRSVCLNLERRQAARRAKLEALERELGIK
ncbi:hypothetical protein OAO01_05050 [Oligoflexia bacterium]|nr:hypothetical protein [Oligoflexia bacterium]